MTVYRMSREAAVATAESHVTLGVRTGLIAGTVGPVVYFFFLMWRKGFTPGWEILVFPALALGLFFLFQKSLVKRLAREQAEELVSFEIEIGPSGLTRRQRKLPDLEIHREEIARVEDNPQLGLIVHTKSRYKRLLIPRTIDGFMEISSFLHQW